MVYLKLKIARKYTKNITQEKLAKVIMTAPTTYAKKENGHVPFTLEEGFRISACMGIPLEELFAELKESIDKEIKNIA